MSQQKYSLISSDSLPPPSNCALLILLPVCNVQSLFGWWHLNHWKRADGGMLWGCHKQWGGSTDEGISSIVSSALLPLKGRRCLCGVFRLLATAEWSLAGMGCSGSSEGSLAAGFPVHWWRRVEERSKQVSCDVLGRQKDPGVPWKWELSTEDYLYKGDCKPLIREGDAEVFFLFIDVDFYFGIKSYTLDLQTLFTFSSAS